MSGQEDNRKYFCGHCIARALIDKKIEVSDDCPSRRGVVCSMCSRKGESDDEFFAYPGMERLIENDNATA